MPMFRGWGDPAPDLWSGFAEEDLEAWLIEYGIWAAMQGGNEPGEDAPSG